jgi:DNA-binding response OmpR family regulator
MLESGKPNVLLVDHDAKSRRCMEVSLRRAGFCVLSASDNMDATEKLHMLPPKLVLTELRGPQVDGLQFCKSIRENPRMANVPVVFLTREAGQLGKHQAHSAGATDYIVKPTFIDDIISRVHHLVGEIETHLETTQPGYRTSLIDTPWEECIAKLGIHDATLSVKNASGTVGNITVRAGSVVDAQVQGLKPGRALRTLLDTDRGIIHIQPGRTKIAARLDIPLSECLHYQPKVQPLSIKELGDLQVALHEDTMRHNLTSEVFLMSDAMLHEVGNEPKLTNIELPVIKDEGWGTDTDWNAIAASHQIDKFDNESLENSVSDPKPQARKTWWKLS